MAAGEAAAEGAAVRNGVVDVVVVVLVLAAGAAAAVDLYWMKCA